MYISEPWTFVTDIILALFSFYFAYRIAQDPQSKLSSAYRLWVGSFSTIGAAALQGALYHGLAHVLPVSLYSAFRIGTLWSLSATALFISLSVLRFACPRKSFTFSLMYFLIFLKFLVFVGLATVHIDFLLAIIDYGSTFVVSLIVFLAFYKRSGAKGMILGILISLAAAAVQMLRLSLSESFNHNDLYHVIQLFGLYVFYRSTRRLQDHR
jgi:hypothetical protein